MKKLVYLLAAGSMAFVACQNSPYHTAELALGDITDGDTIYLQEYAGGNLVKLDSAIVKSGTFVFTGKQDTAVNRYITYMKGDKRYFTDLFLENGNINVTLGKESKVSGTPNNDAYQKFKSYNWRESAETMEVRKCSAMERLSSVFPTPVGPIRTIRVSGMVFIKREGRTCNVRPR